MYPVSHLVHVGFVCDLEESSQLIICIHLLPAYMSFLAKNKLLDCFAAQYLELILPRTPQVSRFSLAVAQLDDAIQSTCPT